MGQMLSGLDVHKQFPIQQVSSKLFNPQCSYPLAVLPEVLRAQQDTPALTCLPGLHISAGS